MHMVITNILLTLVLIVNTINMMANLTALEPSETTMSHLEAIRKWTFKTYLAVNYDK